MNGAASPAASLPAAPAPSLRRNLSTWSKTTPLGRASRLALVFAALGAAVALRIPLCPFALVARHPCPGCGLTRATLALCSGHLHEALHLHPLVLIISPLVGAMLVLNSLSYVRTARWSMFEGLQGRWLTRASTVLAVLMLGVWFARFFGAFGGPAPV